MKKLLRIVPGVVVGLGMMVGTAAADTTTCSGTISNTGPGSKNIVTCVDKNQNTVTCNNNVIVDNNNSQSSSSGSASSSGNTSGGKATSGSSSNNNTVQVNVGASCAPVKNSKGTFTTTSPVKTVSQGQVKGAQVKTAPAGAVAAGGGAGVSDNRALPIAGLAASLALVGIGFGLKKRAAQL